MILDCAHYRDGARQDEDQLAIDEAAERRHGDGFIWLGLHDPEEAELTEVAARFDLPPLAVEDALKAHQRPKLEDYEDGYFLVLHTARYLDDVENPGKKYANTHFDMYKLVYGRDGKPLIHEHWDHVEKSRKMLSFDPNASTAKPD